jgi:5S rRNA maturation endonuclease (ribonuclease M5)
MGKLDLNSIVFNDLISREDILKYLTQEEIYSFYMGEKITSLGVYHSPLREDNIPSFALFFHRVDRDILMFKDFATGDCGDFVAMVRKLFSLSYSEALEKVAYDLGLSNYSVSANKQIINYTKITQKQKVELGIKIRPWQQLDKEFWQPFGIKKSTLKKFNVFPISHVFYNGNAVKTHRCAYAYVEKKDGKLTYKIYQPFEDKLKKWINNANYSVHQGYTQLPKSGELLVITKSLKDVMSIHDIVGVPAIGLQSESVMMKDSVMDEYKSRFKKVVCLFDNDDAGIKLAKEFSKRYNVPHFFVLPISNSKDFSDFVKNTTINFSIEYFNKKIKKLYE